jgi:hypothetical protein
MSPFGTFETCRFHQAISEFEGKAENICSHWVLLSLTFAALTMLAVDVGCLDEPVIEQTDKETFLRDRSLGGGLAVAQECSDGYYCPPPTRAR